MSSTYHYLIIMAEVVNVPLPSYILYTKDHAYSLPLITLLCTILVRPSLNLVLLIKDEI